jgi:hypothetical protein
MPARQDNRSAEDAAQKAIAAASDERSPSETPILRLLLLTALAVLIHGYHLGVDDAAIYVPAIKKAADPSLYPFGAQFFMSHAGLSFFPDLIGFSARLTRLPIDLVIFIWHAAGIFLLLLAAWRLVCACFDGDPARWSGVILLAGVLSVPVAGTALVIMDPYVTARSLSTPATLFAVACYVANKRKSALAWLAAGALIHPQMSIYGAVLIALLAWARRPATIAVPASPVGFPAFPGISFLTDFRPARGAAREALLSRTYFFVFNWAWYEWLGVFFPLALLGWFSLLTPKGTTRAFRRLARTLVPFGLLFTAAAVVLNLFARLENYTRLQPMRAFHLIYVIFFLLLGGLMGEYALGTKVWRWLGLFVPLAVSMWCLQWSAFPYSPHVEWPGLDSGNPWISSFLWIRQHTPKGAVFALDPNHMQLRGEDQHGFRAIAERSMLADNVKDSGAVSLFPQLADEWKREVAAQDGWDKFQLSDFERLSGRYPVTWILTRLPGPAGLICPYRNRELAVCRIERHRD